MSAPLFRFVSLFHSTLAKSFRHFSTQTRREFATTTAHPGICLRADAGEFIHATNRYRDAVSAIICTLIREKLLDDAQLLANKLVCNVEYNEFAAVYGKDAKEPLMAGTNYSVFPGNINVLVLHAPDYLKVLHAKKGAISEFTNPKYRDADKQTFKKPTRLECMMQVSRITPSDRTRQRHCCRQWTPDTLRPGVRESRALERPARHSNFANVAHAS